MYLCISFTGSSKTQKEEKFTIKKNVNINLIKRIMDRKIDFLVVCELNTHEFDSMLIWNRYGCRCIIRIFIGF